MAKAYWTTDISLDHFRALSVGASASGKTKFAMTWPDPLFINFEKGMLYAKTHGLKFPIWDVESMQDVRDVIADPKRIIKEHFDGYPLKTLVFDSASLMGNTTGVAMDEIMKSSSTTKINYPSLQEFGRLTDKMRGFFKLAAELPYHILVIAQVYTEKDDLTGRIQDKPSFIGQMRNEAPVLMDFVFWHDVVPKTGGGVEYTIETVKVGALVSKDRSGLLQPRYVNPSFQTIWADIQKGMNHG